jgi:hypothetical protein
LAAPVIDYDRLRTWSPWFSAAVTKVAGPAIIEAARASKPEYVENARRFFEDEIGVQRLVSGLSEELRPCSVRVYHGTRLSESELISVKSAGLRPLTLAERKPLLTGLFEAHPEWPKVKHRLDDIIRGLGVDWERSGVGRREDGCIHVCLSRAGLTLGCNHYLNNGAEVDQHVASLLFDSERAREFLRANRTPWLISFTAPFEEAARAASPWGFRQHEMPSLLRSLLQVWAFSLSDSTFRVGSLRDGVALRFPGEISADRLKIESVSDRRLPKRPYRD